MSQSIITTWPSQLEVDLAEPVAAMVDIHDIAHALANIPRYIGHTRRPYTVAEHCVIGSYRVAPQYALEFLLHDAHEAYLGDVTSPLKKLLGPEYGLLADRFDAVIAAKYGLGTDAETHGQITKWDLKMRDAEMVVLKSVNPPLFDRYYPQPGDCLEARWVHFGLFDRGAAGFMFRYRELVERRAQAVSA